MFRSIFRRLMVIFISVLILAFVLAGAMLYYFLGNYVARDKIDTLVQSGEAIKSYLSFYIENEDNPLSELLFSRILQLHSRDTGAIIFVTNRDGYLVHSGPELRSLSENIIKNFNTDSGVFRIPDIKQHEKALSEQTATVSIGDLGGLFKDTGYSWLTVKQPFLFRTGRYPEDITGVIYLNMPVPEIQRMRYLIFRFFIVSVAASALLSVIPVYIFSLRLSKPLKEINKAAKLIAGGEFSKRLNIDSKDEIGELAGSFNQMVTALQNLEEMRRDFIANVSHELKTPMTSIRGFIEGILDGTIPEDKHKLYLEIVRDETNRLNRLVNNLLDLARMEAGENTLQFKDFNINELVRRSIIKLEKLITDKDITVDAEFEKEDTFVNADADAIERVMYNLVHNAVKFTPEGGKINLCVRTQKNRVFVSVEDSGPGIPEEERELIWERFHKSDKSRSKDKDGTGLGLAIVKNIIKNHSQEIWVESEPGKGSKFTFTLNKSNK